MKSQRKLLVMLALAASTLACSINIRLPDNWRVQTGPTVAQDIQISGPTDSKETVEVRMEFGAGELRLSPGTGPELISGTATYNIDEFEPKITEEPGRVRLEQGNLALDGIPILSDVINIWDLHLGDHPIRLHIDAGAYEGNLELGGLAIEQLFIADGASSTKLSFSEPNLTEMETFQYTTGASDVRLTGLSNANFTSLTFRGGAGNYVLDFSGDLNRDATVVIDAGLSNVKIVVPKGINATANLETGLSGVSSSGSWRRSGGGYLLTGAGPTIQIEIDIGAGNVELANS